MVKTTTFNAVISFSTVKYIWDSYWKIYCDDHSSLSSFSTVNMWKSWLEWHEALYFFKAVSTFPLANKLFLFCFVILVFSDQIKRWPPSPVGPKYIEHSDTFLSSENRRFRPNIETITYCSYHIAPGYPLIPASLTLHALGPHCSL